MRRRHAIFAVWGLAAALATSTFGLEVPYLSGRVLDTADLLAPETEQRLEAQLGGLEAQTGAQFVVLTIPSLEGEVLEDFALKVAETWELGRAEADDGVLLLVARDERQVRVEVGYGLEGTLPDAACRRVVDRLLVPEFKAGDYDAGVTAAVGALAGAIEGDPEALPPEASDWGGLSGLEALFFAGFLAVTLSPFAFFAIRLKGAQGVFLTLFLVPFFAAFGSVLLGVWSLALAGGWVVLAFLLRPRFATLEGNQGGGRGGRSGGSWSSGSSWSSGGSSFSGGGGSFGGGGASSSW